MEIYLHKQVMSTNSMIPGHMFANIPISLFQCFYCLWLGSDSEPELTPRLPQAPAAIFDELNSLREEDEDDQVNDCFIQREWMLYAFYFNYLTFEDKSKNM